MNLNLFTYFVIIIGIRTIYSQICVNFRILGNNEDERAKGKYTKLKEKVGTHQHSLKLAQARSLQRISPK